MIRTQTYSTNHIVLTNDILSVYINNFWLDIFKPLQDINRDRHLMLMCKVEGGVFSPKYSCVYNIL